MARGVSFSDAPVLERVDLLAGAAAHVPADEPRDGPAAGRVGPPEVEEVLLRLVGRREHGARAAEEAISARLDAKEAAQRGEPKTRILPVVFGVPSELGVHRLGHTPAVGEAELGQHGPRSDGAEVVDQVLAEQAHRDGVEQERALAREADHPSLRIQFEQFLVIQIVDSHAAASRPKAVHGSPSGPSM
jgi:hypothetical protein